MDFTAQKELHIIGLMSGTSLDGLDISFSAVRLDSGKIKARQLYFDSFSYTPEIQRGIKGIIDGKTADVCHWNFKLGTLWSDLILRFLDKYKITAENVDLIGSHGQTVWHIHGDSTLQIGEASVIAERTGIPVVADFRTRDIAAGGSGAPLVPVIDYYLLKDDHKTRIALNIGGIANFTVIPAGANSLDDVWALDTGPGNALINIATERYTNGKLSFDVDGKIAASGKILPEVLEHLLNHPYITAEMPKSTGREVFGYQFIDNLIENFQIRQADLPDLIATLTRFTAGAVRSNYTQFFAERYPADELIVSGGGALNPMLMRHLADLFPECRVFNSEELGISSDGKEALAFAILAALYVWQIPGNVPNVTGAKKQVVLGKLIR